MELGGGGDGGELTCFRGVGEVYRDSKGVLTPYTDRNKEWGSWREGEMQLVE